MDVMNKCKCRYEQDKLTPGSGDQGFVLHVELRMNRRTSDLQHASRNMLHLVAVNGTVIFWTVASVVYC